MPSEYFIVPSRHLVIIRHVGTSTFPDAMANFEAWSNDPAFDPGHSWLMDFAPMQRYDDDPVALMALMAQVAEAVPPALNPPLFVMHAPKDCVGRPMAMMVHKTWDGLDLRLPRVTETEAAALDILGMPERSIAHLIAATTQYSAPHPDNGS